MRHAVQMQNNSLHAAGALVGARRLVIKIGSSLLVNDGTLSHDWLASLGDDIARLRNSGVQVIVVSSGAVALGRGRLGLGPNATVEERHAAAAAGQSLLMRAWESALAPHALNPAQILLTREDTERRRRWLNARSTLEALLRLGAVPVVNENDTVATAEVRYGDNDRLAARTAQLAQADVLVLLSDVDGLYDADPRRNPGARHLPLVETLDAGVMAMAGDANAEAGVGKGGMKTKLEAARIAAAAGCVTIVASGMTRSPLAAVEAGAPATLIAACADKPLDAYRAWIAGSVAPGGALTLDAGALAAIRKGGSLLPAGVRAVKGEFAKGECVHLVDEAGVRAGVGLAAYAHGEMSLIKGRNSAEIEKLVGYEGPQVAVHRDHLAMEPNQ